MYWSCHLFIVLLSLCAQLRSHVLWYYVYFGLYIIIILTPPALPLSSLHRKTPTWVKFHLLPILCLHLCQLSSLYIYNPFINGALTASSNLYTFLILLQDQPCFVLSSQIPNTPSSLSADALAYLNERRNEMVMSIFSYPIYQPTCPYPDHTLPPYMRYTVLDPI